MIVRLHPLPTMPHTYMHIHQSKSDGWAFKTVPHTHVLLLFLVLGFEAFLSFLFYFYFWYSLYPIQFLHLIA